MKLSEICTKRPVLAWVLTLVFVIVGLVGGYRLALQQYPNFERPYITVETNLPGAGPSIVEEQVTRVVEEALSGLEGVETITSTSSIEDSKVTLELRGERKVEDVLNDIRDRLNKFKEKLPDEATEPTLTKSKADEKPIISLAMTSNELDTGELADIANNEIQKDLESVTGVARVDVLGAGQYVMHIYLDPVKLAAYNVSVTDVSRALKRQNLEKPAGKLIGSGREYMVTTVANLERPEEFNNMIVTTYKNSLVRLRDVGYAKITSDDQRTRTRYNGKPGISLGVIKQTDVNPIEVARAVKEMLPKIKSQLPEEVDIRVGYDKTLFIEKSIKQVYWTIFEATLLVVLVVMVFLRSARSTIIPLVTIPVSLIGVMFFMYLFGFSINTLTLMAMVLAIGMVVDDAIVVLENIHRYIEQGMKPFDAAIKGIREISFAIIAMTLTLAAVYLPIAFAEGVIGKLFTEFAVTLAGAVIISGFAALTLSPMMCARMIKKHKKPTKKDLSSASGFRRFAMNFMSDGWLDQIDAFYADKLKSALNNKYKIILSSLAFALFGFAVYKTLPQVMFPRQDSGRIEINGRAPQSSTLEYTEEFVDKMDKLMNKVVDIDRRMMQINNPTFDGYIQLKEDRKESTYDVVKWLQEQFNDIIGLEIHVNASDGGAGGRSNSIDFVIKGNKSLEEIKKVSKYMVFYLYRSGIVDLVQATTEDDTTDFIVTILRDVAASLKIEPLTISDTIDTLIRGRKVSTFRRKNRLYDVKIEVEDVARQTPHDITNLFVKAGDRDETLVPLSELVRVTSRPGPIEIAHHNRMRSVTILARLSDGVSTKDGIELVEEIARDVLPRDMRYDFIGSTKRFLKESYNVYFIFGLALIFIYLVMAAQFESWRDPFIIMLSVPLSLAGAVMTLALINKGSINLYSQIGLITLIGLITKHGIMMVDFANKLRDEGKALNAAIIEACRLRLRPILMTTLAMVLGAVPLALATGAGAEVRRQIGWVIVGGMSIGTIFTLFVIPSVYVLLSRKKRKSTTTISSEPL